MTLIRSANMQQQQHRNVVLLCFKAKSALVRRAGKL